MNKYLNFLCLISLFSNLMLTAQCQTLAFPGAEGYGRFATGGRGGDVYHVTNLNDDGIGSLRYGIENANGPRTIVFDISGNINLNQRIRIDKPNITIAGQTAPGDGITLAGESLFIYSGNVIVRYIRCRFGDVSGNISDAVSIVSGSNIIVDHVTASWSVDETFSCQSSFVDSLTVQWCMIAESLNNSIHTKGTHGYGEIIGSLSQTFHHNIYAHHNSRSPKVTGRRHCLVDFRNNVIYNWGKNSCYDGTSSYINWVNNYYKSGPATQKDVKSRIFELSDEDIPGGPDNPYNIPEDSKNYETSLYVDGNYVDGFPDVTANNRLGIAYMLGATEERNLVHNPAFNTPAIQQQSAIDCYPLVIAGAGASLVRDSIDNRIIQEIKNGSYTYGNLGLIDSQTDVGGWPVLHSLPALTDTDQDGMSDEWEILHHLNPQDPADRNIIENNDGFTNLEVYLNSFLSRSPMAISVIKNNLQIFFYNQNNQSFYFNLNEIENSDLKIYNCCGQCVYQSIINSEFLRINDCKLNSGVYLVRIISKNKEVYASRILLENS